MKSLMILLEERKYFCYKIIFEIACCINSFFLENTFAAYPKIIFLPEEKIIAFLILVKTLLFNIGLRFIQ